MSQHIDGKLQSASHKTPLHGPEVYDRGDLEHYYRANLKMEADRHQIEDTEKEIEELAHSRAVELFQKQVGLLQRRLMDDPEFFQDMFIKEGTHAIAWEFRLVFIVG